MLRHGKGLFMNGLRGIKKDNLKFIDQNIFGLCDVCQKVINFGDEYYCINERKYCVRCGEYLFREIAE